MSDFDDYWRKVSVNLDRWKQDFMFSHSLEALDATAEVFMEQAIEAMHKSANALTGHDEEPISTAARKEACLSLCSTTFDRLQGQWRVIAERNKT